MNDLLNSLKINENNFGSCSGPGNWLENSDTKVIKSYNPSNGDLIASVYEATVDEYNSYGTRRGAEVSYHPTCVVAESVVRHRVRKLLVDLT